MGTDIDKRNQAICAYMGGPHALREALGHHDDAEFDFTELSDIKFHVSWDWLMPVWKKVRLDLTPTMVIKAVVCIDDANLEELYQLLSQVCINWCATKKIEL